MRPAAPVTGAAASRRWRPTPLVQASMALHCGAAALTLWQPRWWPWTIGAAVADQLLLSAAGLLPRSSALGPNWTRLPSAGGACAQVAITLDDGPDPQVTPQVLQILAAHRVRATFFCIGTCARQYPDLVQGCIAGGHAVENHSYSHRATFALLGPGRLRSEVERAQELLTQLSGTAPRFFRAPAGLRNAWLDPLLQRCGLQLASWTRRGYDTLRADPRTVLARLTRNLGAGDILLLHDGHAARSRGGQAMVLEVLPRLLEALERRGLQPVTLREALP